MSVTIRYWAAARAAAGVTDEEYADAATLADLVRAASAGNAKLAAVLSVCSFVVGEQPVGTRAHTEVVLHDGDVVEALPPFAGGSATARGERA